MGRHFLDEKKPDGATYPMWWEDEDNPDVFGNICALCRMECGPDTNANAAKGTNWDGNQYESGFCICMWCQATKGAKPADPSIDRHDKAIMQRFSAFQRALRQEIKDAKRREQNWGSVGALQSRFAHYGHHR